ncbi:hypothetical protein CNMCM8980_002079 [Aspergillus fumigatiaffinis]|jgi:hypothetical protein|uniref:Uncharacterized protein n=1 Tax=Aspergillus fumigatiaffinis TaxID=340414 RepID=A0A8H4GTY7_9EURO|nr:hypothetical protein CNMCM5878_002557 [Aspergillus fumigatiaffinis]KAF4220893.1 hypothetical protein CNMCM6457_002179 [Aspergillus fumigatiaffinis]KAF4228221.1 hypothetical protein CNMCM6805_002288 [Aspergillus fumigatiaffinis]KAF4238539.1 hypothetical protein CNMCM8980_002079 [Aspergillus fumigatiaffinis]
MTTSAPKDLSQKHEPIAISLTQILKLVGALLTLKMLHAVALVFRIEQAAVRHPVRGAIHRREQQIVRIFLSSIPETYYVPVIGNFFSNDLPLTSIATNSVSIQQSQRPTNAVEAQSTERTSSNQNSLLMQVSSSIEPAVRMSQGLVDREAELSKNKSESGMDSMIPAAGSDSLYSNTTIKRSTSVRRMHSRSSSMQQHMAGSAAQYAKLVSGRPQFSTSRPMSMESTDGQQPRPTDDSTNDQTLLEMETLQATHSVESFPGKFPISDGLEFSSLATAPHHIRGRGTTSVRPFSDV